MMERPTQEQVIDARKVLALEAYFNQIEQLDKQITK